jgi:hypothetical protein
VFITGEVTMLQVQSKSLKRGTRPKSWYDPVSIVRVDSILVADSGVIGLTQDGTQLIDVHNSIHANTKNKGFNSISVGFAFNYEEMRAQYGIHLVDGIAGENIVVLTKGYIEPSRITKVMLTPDIVQTNCILEFNRPVPPCIEFAHYCLKTGFEEGTSERVTHALDFLGNGRRGILVEVPKYVPPFRINVGDAVHIEISD